MSFAFDLSGIIFMMANIVVLAAGLIMGLISLGFWISFKRNRKSAQIRLVGPFLISSLALTVFGGLGLLWMALLGRHKSETREMRDLMDIVSPFYLVLLAAATVLFIVLRRISIRKSIEQERFV